MIQFNIILPAFILMFLNQLSAV